MLVTSTPIDVLLPRLRELGRRRWSRPRTGPSASPGPTSSGRERPATAAARNLRSARESAHVAQVVTCDPGRRPRDRVPPGPPAEALTPSGSLAALREAIEAGATVLIGYVDNHGTSSERVVDPLRVEGGWLTAHDHRSDDTRTFAVHRITTVRPIPD